MKAFTFGFLALILLSSVPCSAQIETERFFTPKGTLWQLQGVGDQIGFYDGNVWICSDCRNVGGCPDCKRITDSDYTNRLSSSFQASYCDENDLNCINLSGYTISFLRFGNLILCSEFEGCLSFSLYKFSNFFSP